MPFESIACLTCAWGFLGYIMLPWGPTAKMTGQNEAQKTFGDRCFMNLVEQAAFWLSSLWMCAFFVGEETAFRVGTVYVALRYLYPIMWMLKGGNNVGYPMPVGFFITFPAYACILYMYATVLAKAGFGIEFSTMIIDYATIPIGGFVYMKFAVTVGPCLQNSIFKK